MDRNTTVYAPSRPLEAFSLDQPQLWPVASHPILGQKRVADRWLGVAKSWNCPGAIFT